MSDIERRMIRQAERKYKKIFPCCHKESFSECFTRVENRVLFWFNTEDHSTHVLSKELNSRFGRMS